MHKRADTFVGRGEWAKHLGSALKRNVAKAERQAARQAISGEILELDETPTGLGLHNSPRAMRGLRAAKGELAIPRGMYCYNGDGICPYWDKVSAGEHEGDGYCWYLDKGDWDSGMVALFDQCKCCGIRDDDAPDGTVSISDERKEVAK